MLQKFSRSIVLRITSMMISLILMVFISTFSSMYMSQISEFDGKTINLSGSLRMMSYRIFTQVAVMEQSPTPQNHLKVQQLIQRFDILFHDPLLTKDFIRFKEIKLQQDYNNIETQWQTVIKPTLSNATTDFKLEQFLPKVEAFVDSINGLVYGYQKLLEKRLTLLKIIQSATLSIALILILLSLYSIHKHIARPLRELTRVANASSKGDWSQRSQVEREDELGLLSNTLNKANQSMQTIHQDLEQRITNKTQELSRNNKILTFLYDVAQQVNHSHNGHLNFHQILDELCRISMLQRLELKLFADNNATPYQHIVSMPSDKKDERAISVGTTFPIQRNDFHYGEVLAATVDNQTLQAWQKDLVQSLVDQLAIALSLSYQLNQERRLALLDERAIIARELHDSLAQSLSYLKFQVACIEKGIQKEPVSERVLTPVSELKEGLISAYRQLRELLTTFRLQIGNGGLQVALSDTIDHLSKHSDIDIHVHYDCQHVPFTPNEEIHLLQIAKEAVQNALNHSQGTFIAVSVIEHDNKSVQLLIKDNGIGIAQSGPELNHYGMEIIQERCHSLAGTLNIDPIEPCGTQIDLTFMPSYLSQ